MITGDAGNGAESVAAELGIDELFAAVLPEHKAEAVTQLQTRGLRVARVVDGMNDAPARPDRPRHAGGGDTQGPSPAHASSRV